MAVKRIYHVTDGKIDTLVNAKSPSQARSHVARNKYGVNLASQHKIVELLGKGTKVQEAGDEDEPEAPAQASI